MTAVAWVTKPSLNYIKKKERALEEVIDTEDELLRRTDSRLPEAALSILEAQANIFASCLVIPRFNLRGVVMAKQAELGINRNLGTIFVNPDNQSQADFGRIVAHLQDTFGVSKQSLYIKLKSLGMLKAHPTSEAMLLGRHSASVSHAGSPRTTDDSREEPSI